MCAALAVGARNAWSDKTGTCALYASSIAPRILESRLMVSFHFPLWLVLVAAVLRGDQRRQESQVQVLRRSDFERDTYARICIGPRLEIRDSSSRRRSSTIHTSGLSLPDYVDSRSAFRRMHVHVGDSIA